jgi:hypothetical protein
MPRRVQAPRNNALAHDGVILSQAKDLSLQCNCNSIRRVSRRHHVRAKACQSTLPFISSAVQGCNKT